MTITKLISIDDFKKLVDEVESDRDKIAIMLLFSTGMRVEELVTTKLENIDTVEGIIHIHAARTKTRRYREVVVLESMIPDLKKWTESLPRDSIWLFPGRDPSKHLSQRWIRMMIDRAARSAGIQRSYDTSRDGRALNIVTPHSLRHAHAVAALDAGVPLNDLQEQLGHASIRTTGIYLRAGINHRKSSYQKMSI
jgi:integrase/recombinase XerD